MSEIFKIIDLFCKKNGVSVWLRCFSANDSSIKIIHVAKKGGFKSYFRATNFAKDGLEKN